MARNVGVNLVIKGVDKVSGTLDRITKKFPKLGRHAKRTAKTFAILQKRTEKLRRSLSKMGKKMQGIGRSATVGLTAPIGLAAGAVLRTSLDFQKSINKVGAITDGVIDGKVTPAFASLEKQALKLGATTEFSSTQAADAMIELGKAGFSTNEILDSTDDVLALASASGFDLAFTANTMAKTIRAFGLEANDAGKVADVLSNISRKSNVDLETLGETFKASAPIAKAYGATLEQTAAITGLLGDVGIQGSLAGTTLKNVFLKIAKPSGRAAKIMAGLGVATTTATGGMRSAGDILTDLAPKLGKLNKDKQLDAVNELFGLRGIAGASALMAKAMKEGKNPIAEMTNVLNNSEGVAKKMQKVMLRGLPGAMARFNSALEGAGLAIGKSGLVEWFADILTGLTDMFSKISQTSPGLLKWGTIVALVAAAAGPLLIAIGGLVAMLPFVITGVTALTTVSLPLIGTILAIVAAIGLLIFAGVKVVQNWESIKEFFTKLWDGPLVQFLLFITGIKGLINMAQWVMAAWAPLAEFFSGLFGGIGDLIGRMVNAVAPTLGKLADLLLFGKGESFFGGGEGAVGAGAATKQIGEGGATTQTNNASVDLNIKGAPAGSSARGSGPGLGALNIGFSGATQ